MSKGYHTILFFITVALLAGKLQAKNIFVSASGSNRNKGLSISQPLLSINKALQLAQAGDTVYILPGTYREKMQIAHKSGVPEKYIYLYGYPATGKTIIDGGAPRPAMSLSHNWIECNNASWIEFGNLVFQNGWTDPVRLEAASYISFKHCRFFGGRKLILATGAATHHILVEHCFWDQGGEKLWTIDKDSLGVDAWLSMHHELMGYYNGSLIDSRASGGSIVVRYNQVQNAYNGVRFTSQKGYDANIEIYGNVFRNIRDNDIEPEHYAYNMHIYHNRSHNVHKTVSIDRVSGGYIYYYGNTVTMDADEWSRKICTGFWKIYGDEEDSLSFPMYAFNNSFYGYGKAFNAMEGRAHQLKHYNNAYYFAGNEGWILKYTDPSNAFDYDLSNKPWSASLVSNAFEQHGKINDAGFVNGARGNLRLLPGSPCIDAGKALSLPEFDWIQSYHGKAPDIGAYEGDTLANGPAFRFRIPYGAKFNYKEKPRIVKYRTDRNKLFLYFSEGVNPRSLAQQAILLQQKGEVCQVKKAGFSRNSYELEIETDRALDPRNIAVAFTTMPVGVNGETVTYWASAIPIIQRSVTTSNTIQHKALQQAEAITDKLIRDTRFTFTLAPQKEVVGMQVIDYSGIVKKATPVAYAVRYIKANTDTTIHMQVHGAGAITIWLNKQKVFHKPEGQSPAPVEFAYGRFAFKEGWQGDFRKGTNEMIIRYEANAAQPIVLLRPQEPNGDLNTALDYNVDAPFAGWKLLGPFSLHDTTFQPVQPIRSFYSIGTKIYNWQQPVQRMLPELTIDTTITYQRDAYADWHYANGTTWWSVMNLANATKNPLYTDAIKKYTGFVLEHSNYFRKQYDSLAAFRGAFHKLFRKTMLDDAGAAALPFLQLYLANKDATLRPITDSLAAYIMHGQVRLPDGTFCRPEPEAYTVWADDLFMSVPFLLRMSAITGDQSYANEAVQQFIHFRSYLLNPATGLYRHGWYSTTKQQTPISWGRANGWIAWATTELLEMLPPSHPAYPAILAAFKAQMAALLPYQDATGMWLQILNRPDAYPETSCTAIFTLAMAKGVRKGWLDPSYKVHALHAWTAISQRIEADGTVHGICRGTEIGPDATFYLNRKTIDQDPRGLGAVITAGLEISRLP